MIKIGEGYSSIFVGSKIKMFMKKNIFLGFLLLALFGCAEAEHLDQLLVMKAAGDNQSLQVKAVHLQNNNFKSLLKTINENHLKDYPDKKSILKKFGEPAYEKIVKDGDVLKEKWLYRRAKDFFGAEKVYLYFDDKGNLLDYKYIKPDHDEDDT